jgi:uroporphyrin-III C-methyltransferase/precorrin-2 dehydrogenase/sirohydrochlorin ferrochelatase
LRYLPLFVDLRDRDCLIVGGGEVALRKARLLVRAGARLHVVAPSVHAGLESVAASIHRRPFADGDVRPGIALAVAATASDAVNAQVAAACARAHVPVNVVDSAALSNVVFPSIVDRDPVMVAFGTGGSSPVLARLLRGQLERLLPARLGDLARLAGRYRARAVEQLQPHARRRFWERVLEGPVAASTFAGDGEAAEAALQAALRDAGAAGVPAVAAEVTLVGAGPGDPELLTLKALQALAGADVILHDALVSADVLDMARRDAVRELVGGRRGERTEPARVVARMVELARAGQRVVRLKGGDPGIFGRGGEELAGLAAAGVVARVVPGVTAALAAAAVAGVSLTHRDYADSVLIVTARRRGGAVDVDWPRLVAPRQTLAVYMGGEVLRELCAGLVAHGAAAALPALLVENATLPAGQRIVGGTLASLPDAAAPGAGDGPALLLVGEVLGLRRAPAAVTPT